MTQYEFRMTQHDNSEVWGVFGVLCLMSIGYPLLVFIYTSRRNNKLKLN